VDDDGGGLKQTVGDVSLVSHDSPDDSFPVCHTAALERNVFRHGPISFGALRIEVGKRTSARMRQREQQHGGGTMYLPAADHCIVALNVAGKVQVDLFQKTNPVGCAARTAG
jgi:hypothetical protein